MSTWFRRWTAIAVIAAGLVMSVPGAHAQSARLDVNDVAFLWPPPLTPDKVDGLLAGSTPLDAAGATLWPQDAFDLLRTTAASTRVTSSSGIAFGIDFTPFASQFAQLGTWKVVGIRIDPSAPGSHPASVSRFGSTPQIRLVLQPVTVAGTKVRVHDVAAHVAYSFVSGVNATTQVATPNRDLFRAIVADLVSLKGAARQRGIDTTGPLGVHPAISREGVDFQNQIAAFLRRWLPQGRLTEMAFIGVDPPEPWIFVAMARRPDGSFVTIPPPNRDGATAQMLNLRGGDPVVPIVHTQNVDDEAGVSTEPLFRDELADSMNSPAIPGRARPLLGDIPDIVANPSMATVRNTDCVSCHSETTRRSLLDITTDGRFAYARADAVSGVDPSVLPKVVWNLRNFGWFQDRAGTIFPTVSMRTANEAADAVATLNAQYLGVATASPAPALSQPERTVMSPAPVPVASPLTLVMTTKSAEDTAALKALVGRIQGLPPEQNPIMQALTKLGTVHFARFVFLNDRQLAVITTYDGSFEDYIDAFVNSIGAVFDQLLAHMADAPPLPVSDHRDEFLAYVRKNDLTAIPPFYSAYPRLKVMDILTLDKQRSK